MNEASHDDLKIIAQFLARRHPNEPPWRNFIGEAFQLRRQLKERGGYRLKRVGV